MFDDCIIMAGGSGTRLWPASNSVNPKQFLPVSAAGTEIFFSLSLERAFSVIKNDGRINIIAGKSHIPHIIKVCSQLSDSEKKHLMLIAEPAAKNTGPAIACAASYSQKTSGKNKTMLVLTSDHIITPQEAFLNDAAKAADLAAKNSLVLFGITPAKPETGYGYIETAENLPENVYSVKAFHEKPDSLTAQQYFDSGRYFWNSGMFAFSLEFITEKFKQLANDIFHPFEELDVPNANSFSTVNGLHILDGWEGLDNTYSSIKKIPFDKAIAEKCPCTVMVKASFNWTDIGCWDDYAQLLASGSASGFGAEVYASGASENCFVYSDIPVALAGVEDLIVVIRSGKDGSSAAALVTKKGETQQVREIVEKIQQAGRTDIL